MLLKAISILYYLLFAATPFLMSSKTSEIFEFNKMMFIYGITITISFFYILYYIFNRPKIRYNIFFLGFIVFLLSQLLSTLFSIDKHSSFYGVYGRWNGGVLSILSFGVLSFIFLQTISFYTVRKLLQISLLVATVVVFWGLPAKFGGDLSCLYFTGQLTNSCWTAQFQPAQRMFSTLGQPNWLGAYLAAHFFISVMFFAQLLFKSENHRSLFTKFKNLLLSADKFKAYFYLLISFFMLLGTWFTGSRSSLIAIFISSATAFIFYKTQSLIKQRKTLARSVLITALLLCTFLAISYLSSFEAKKVPENLVVTDSFTIRSIVWEGALKLALKYPFFGTGPETFGTSYFFVKPESHNRTSEWDFVYNKAHNEFLHILATTGFVGFTSYIFFVFAALVTIAKKIDHLKIEKKIYTYGFLMSFISILVTNFFGFSTSTLQLLLYLIPVMYCIIFNDYKYSKNIKKHWNLTIASFVLLTTFISFFLYPKLGRYVIADRIYKQAILAESADDIITAATLYKKAVDTRYEPIYYDKLSSALAQVAFIQSFGQDNDKYQELVKSSIMAHEIAISSSPKNIQFWRTKARNYYLYYQVSQNIQDLKKGVEAMTYTTILAPTDAQSFYLAGVFYKILADESEDIKYQTKSKINLDRAIKLNPMINADF